MIYYNYLSNKFGIEIKNIDILNISDKERLELIKLLNKFRLIIIREQDLNAEQLLEFSLIFGKPTFYPFAKGIDRKGYVIEILNRENHEEKFSQRWHVDSSYLENPPIYSVLYAVEVPKIGGDTIILDSKSAFQGFSTKFQNFLKKLEIVNTSNLYKSEDRNSFFSNDSETINNDVLLAKHRAVIYNKKTNEFSFLINEEHTKSITGLTGIETKSILELIQRQIDKHEYTYRIKWDIGTIAIWDNLSTQHRAVNDYMGIKRVMRRVTLR